MHTTFCDGRDSAEDMVKSAIRHGFGIIGFSGHAYAPYDGDCCMTLRDTAAYLEELRSLRQRYADRIRIYAGAEQDIFGPHLYLDGNEVREDPERVRKSPYDYVIGSVHYLKLGERYWPIDLSEQVLMEVCRDFFAGDIYALAACYYETVAEVAAQTDCDLIGHFDLISKFNEGDRLFSSTDPRYVRAWKSAADRLIPCGVPFEINTGAMSRGYRSSPYPSLPILHYLKDHGARFILSSDAHSADHIGFAFDSTEKKMEQEGIPLMEISDPGDFRA